MNARAKYLWQTQKLSILLAALLFIVALIVRVFSLSDGASVKESADILTATAAVAGAFIAWNGLSAWKKQLHGNTDHEIAWKYIEAALKLRNAINRDVRNPFISLGEFRIASEEFYGKENVDAEIKKNPQAQKIAVYSIRWKEVNKARKELDDAAVQAEIWWGAAVIGLEKPMIECVAALFVNVQGLIDPDYATPDRGILYYLETEENAYDIKLNAAMKKIEGFFRPYLRDNGLE